jgi:cellulose synthase/poly-beta-1,6-N-acetylglucosamine synthase-like glycosyltransferase
MSRLLRLAYSMQAIRHLAVLNASVRTRRELRGSPLTLPSQANTRVCIVVPLFKEQPAVPEVVAHFSTMLDSLTSLFLVTTERERVVGARLRDTMTEEVAAASADGERVLHLHAPEPTARKGDQLNHAARVIAENTPRYQYSDTFIAIYDADSRPDLSSLQEARQQARNYPTVSIFQQSARFHVPEIAGSPRGPWRRALLESAALRANRFVLSYEWPRLENRAPDQPLHRRVSSRYIFANVAGHGLFLRLDWLLANPFPESTVMEDLQYSYGLAVANVPVVPLRTLDNSEVPPSLSTQLRQAERWFLGPARIYQYRRTLQKDQHSLSAAAVAASATLISLEWLSCAVAPVLLLIGLRRRELRVWTALFLLAYTLELLVADEFQEPDSNRAERMRRLVCYPVANCVFGAGGWFGLYKLVTRGSVADKTRRAS